MICSNAFMCVMPWMVVMVSTTSLLEPVEPLGLDVHTGLDALKTPCSLTMSLRGWLGSRQVHVSQFEASIASKYFIYV